MLRNLRNQFHMRESIDAVVRCEPHEAMAILHHVENCRLREAVLDTEVFETGGNGSFGKRRWDFSLLDRLGERGERECKIENENGKMACGSRFGARPPPVWASDPVRVG